MVGGISDNYFVINFDNNILKIFQACWKEKLGEWQKRPKAKLPKWCGVRPGKKEGDPETPEGEEEEAEAEAEEEYDEEGEEYDEEEE